MGSLYVVLYLLTNVISACAIVFANKAVLSVVGFRFTVALTCLHTIATLITIRLLCVAGLITPKKLPRRPVLALAGAFTGYIVLCNVSLFLNTVGFYQLTKIAIAPTVLIIDAVLTHKIPRLNVTACVGLVCVGIGLATLSDTQVMTNLPGLAVGVVSVIVSAQYGVWIGSITKVHEVTSMQLLEQYLPSASTAMALCVPLESLMLAITDPQAPNLLTFPYSKFAIAAIALSSILGVVVTLSTFLVISHTSPLTYAVMGHVKTVVIIGGGVLLFGDNLSGVKVTGIAMALAGVLAYTLVKTQSTQGRFK
jgi:solute carrier family 35 protein E3